MAVAFTVNSEISRLARSRRHPMSPIGSLSEEKRTSPKRPENDAIDPERSSAKAKSRAAAVSCHWHDMLSFRPEGTVGGGNPYVGHKTIGVLCAFWWHGIDIGYRRPRSSA